MDQSARMVPFHSVSNCKSDEYLTETQECLQIICDISEREQNNINQRIERLTSLPEVARHKCICGDCPRNVCHNVKQDRIEQYFREAYTPSEFNLKPSHNVYRTQESLKPCDDHADNMGNDEIESTPQIAQASSITDRHSPVLDCKLCLNHCSAQLGKPSGIRSSTLNYFENDETIDHCVKREKYPEPRNGYRLCPKQIQRIKSSTDQRNKLRSIREECKNHLQNDYETLGNINCCSVDSNPTRNCHQMHDSIDKPKSCKLLFAPHFPNLESSRNSSSMSGEAENPLVQSPNNLRGGTSNQISMPNNNEFTERNFFINTGINKIEIKEKDSWEPFPNEGPHVKTCISCGKILREEADLMKLEGPISQTDLFKTIWEEDGSFKKEFASCQTQNSEGMPHRKKLCKVEDDFQPVLSNIEPEISLREFVLLLAPIMPDEGKLMKKATKDQFFKLLKNVDMLFASKLQEIAHSMKNKHHAELKNYEDCERRIAHQKSHLEAKIQSVLPDFDLKEYLRNEEYLTKALEKASDKFQMAGSWFQEARKRQHAQLQVLKTEVGKVKKENLALKTEFESVKKNCEIHQRQIDGLPTILEKFKANLQIANKFHEELACSAKLVAELAEK